MINITIESNSKNESKTSEQYLIFMWGSVRIRMIKFLNSMQDILKIKRFRRDNIIVILFVCPNKHCFFTATSNCRIDNNNTWMLLKVYIKKKMIQMSLNFSGFPDVGYKTLKRQNNNSIYRYNFFVFAKLIRWTTMLL